MHYQTQKYVDDRVERMMRSLKRIQSSELPDERKEIELKQMFTWHTLRTMTEVKAQIGFVLSYHVPKNIGDIIDRVLNHFFMVK